jgi:integrase
VTVRRWIKRRWRAAQSSAGIRRPIRWHDLRHQFVSLLIAAGKNPLYIAQQAGHADAGFTLKRYGHLFKTIKPTPVEWPEDLLWPSGCHVSVTLLASNSPQEGTEHTSGTNARDPD